MTDPQAAQLGAVVAALAILAFYGVVFVLLVLGTCHLWLDLRERLAERRQQRLARQQAAFKAPERMTVQQWAELHRDDRFDGRQPRPRRGVPIPPPEAP